MITLHSPVLACLLLFSLIGDVAALRRIGLDSVTFCSTERKRKIGPNSVRNRFPLSRECASQNDINHITECAASTGAVFMTLGRGAALRVASDLSGGTPLESIKCRVTKTTDGPIEACKKIIAEGGIQNLWAGSFSRTIEGILLGAFFLLGSNAAKKQVFAMGGSKTAAALAGGLVGGLAQAVVMTPAGMVFTSLNLNRGKKGYEDDNFLTVTKRIYQERGLNGMFCGGGPMAMRQATNWMSRSCFTEIARTTFRMSEFGLLGEIGAGAIGGIGSCWNTPIETIRVYLQADVGAGKDAKTPVEYWNDIVEEQGYSGLFRGVTPRGIQAIWQTVFMVTVPNLLGI
eukprot:CAMPEP_0194130950 /NCGR_PEP_ID=MMETSP0152-20130528/1834_1 /TAXON_ID=1049557 /ORGANISM="Thalassiothrix antarctica, Strain L6-D1" /LENGTH=343 /DNA_ID=CAMNT_0038825593 /DNA_START=95 /DNA_END=1126 /DNA_ORIENTATION=+